MADKELTRLLQQVHDELETTGDVSTEDRVLMRELVDDIHRTLGDDDDEELGVGERLNDAVDQFHKTHPTLAFALRRIIDALARMGI